MQDPTEKIGIKESITEALDILRHMRTRSSMASSYVTMLEKAQEGLRYANSALSKEVSSSFQAYGTDNIAPADLPNTGDMAGATNFEDILRTQGAAGNAWNMHDMYLMPWEMVVDNPMRSFHL